MVIIPSLNSHYALYHFCLKFIIAEGQEFNNQLFTKNEGEILELLSSIFLNDQKNLVVEFSHNEKAWKENEGEGKMVNYNYAFDINQK